MEAIQRDVSRKEGNPGGDNPRNREVKKVKNHHPTVKPVTLIEYLIKLICPPNGIVLDPFMGSGTTGVTCKKLDCHFIGLEKEKSYFEIAKKRINAIPQSLPLKTIKI